MAPHQPSRRTPLYLGTVTATPKEPGFLYLAEALLQASLNNVLLALGLAFGGAVLFVLGLITGPRADATARAKVNRETARWLLAKVKWNQLYYCNRCGSVFNPTRGDRFVPASRMKELLV
jgi:hypothetical protein